MNGFLLILSILIQSPDTLVTHETYIETFRFIKENEFVVLDMKDSLSYYKDNILISKVRVEHIDKSTFGDMNLITNFKGETQIGLLYKYQNKKSFVILFKLKAGKFEVINSATFDETYVTLQMSKTFLFLSNSEHLTKVKIKSLQAVSMDCYYCRYLKKNRKGIFVTSSGDLFKLKNDSLINQFNKNNWIVITINNSKVYIYDAKQS